MKYLIVSRHAKTEPFTSASTDFDRVLTDRGHKDILLVANYLSLHHPIPQSIYYSSAARTRESAEDFKAYLSEYIPSEIGMHAVPNLYMGDTMEIVDTIYDIPDEIDCAMIIGHNPSIADFISQHGGRMEVPTTGTAFYKFDENSWMDWQTSGLEFIDFITPKMIKQD